MTETLTQHRLQTTDGSAPSGRRDLAGYIPTLDGWRAIAILLVFISHSCHDLIPLLHLPNTKAVENRLFYGILAWTYFLASAGC